ncbi:hypothetical protein B0H14DRAFT_3479650 [Mycena olivaceomarginata]|nr:hypothetical protein B0H14DRAFT_3479650 [Mycena olivaceomarginata]
MARDTNPNTFKYDIPLYRLSEADIVPTPGHPFLTVLPKEHGPSRIRIAVQSWLVFYFFAHPAIYWLLPFIRVPEFPVFEHIQRTYVFILRLFPSSSLSTRTLDGLLSSPLPSLKPLRVGTTYPPLPVDWIFPGTEEFPENHPLHDLLSVEDHTTLLCIARPTLRFFISFAAKGLATDSGGSELAVTLLDEAINPEYPIFFFIQEMISNEFCAERLSPEFTHFFFNSTRALISFLPAEVRKPEWSLHILPEDPQYASRFLSPTFMVPRAPHEDLSEEPYPIMDMVTLDPIWKWWRHLQQEFALPVEESSPPSPSNSRAGTYSPHYRPMTPPSASPAPNPATPPVQTGPFAVGSASFDIRLWRGSVKKDPSLPRRVSAIAASPSHSTEMQVDSQDASVTNALAVAEALDNLHPQHGPPRAAARGRKPARGGMRPTQPTAIAQGRPMIITRSSRKSVTLPAEEAYNEEGEEEKEDEDEEEEPARPAKRQWTSSSAPKGKGKGKAKANTPAPSTGSSRFPLVERKTRGKHKKNELPLYVPPRPVPSMDMVRLAAESLAKEQSEPTVFDAGCSNCVFRTPFHCSHTFTVSDHTRAANHLELYTQLSNERGNKLVTDLPTARANYKLAWEQLFRAGACLAVASNRVGAWICGMISSLGPDRLPGMAELPEELQPLWAQLLLDSQRDLSVDYRATVLQYPFISDPCRTESTTDGDFAALLDFLERRTAQAQRSTPPAEEGSNWPDEDEAGPSGSK